VTVCPATGAGEPFSPRDYILWAREGLEKEYHPLFKNRTSEPDAPSPDDLFSEERIWHCTTCRACLEVCPVYVATPEALRQTRSKVVEAGRDVPDALSQTLKKVYKYNNPWEASKTKRTRWTEGLSVPDFSKGVDDAEFCYFVGCTTAMEPRAQVIARSFAAVLNHAGVPFGTLGRKEPCCGDIARRAGEDGLFEINREDCTALFEDCDVSRVVTSSPHCFHTFKNTYASYGTLGDEASNVRFTVRHYSEVLAQLVDDGRLRFNKKMPLTVTFHDPCYLGRYNRIFDAPRRVIRAIPGIRFKEMPHHGPDSLCCGGGGDRMWQEELDGDPKMSVVRVREAEAVGADLVITACPLCLIMLEDARKVDGLADRLQVMDLNELVAKMAGGEAAGPPGS
jgi:Fe-S oxidoreductase